MYHVEIYSLVVQFQLQRNTDFCFFILANRCPAGHVQCQGPSPSRQCIRQSWMCDGDNDCGNYWDENRENCRKYCSIPQAHIKCAQIYYQKQLQAYNLEVRLNRLGSKYIGKCISTVIQTSTLTIRQFNIFVSNPIIGMHH